jgi:hypothetical protein
MLEAKPPSSGSSGAAGAAAHIHAERAGRRDPGWRMSRTRGSTAEDVAFHGESRVGFRDGGCRGCESRPRGEPWMEGARRQTAELCTKNSERLH